MQRKAVMPVKSSRKGSGKCPGCTYAAKQQQTYLKVLPSLKNLNLLTFLNARRHPQQLSAALPEMSTGCTFPSCLLCAASWETCYWQVRGPDSRSPWRRGGGEAIAWKKKENMEAQIFVPLWKLEGGEKLWLGLQIRSESWKWENWSRNGLAKKSELGEEGTWIWGLGGGFCCLKGKLNEGTPSKWEAVWRAGVPGTGWVKESQTS